MGTRQSIKRSGGLTEPEKALITAVVLDQPGEMRPAQVTHLAKALRRSTEVVKQVIEGAQDKFRENADFYVQSHRDAVADALANGDAKSLGVAAAASQWAIERISAEGTRIIEKSNAESGNHGPRVMIGIQVGGLDATKAPAVTVTEVPT